MSSNNTTTTPDRVDVRGPRFAAWVTTAVLVVTLVVSAFNPLAAAVILGVQAVIFAIGAVAGPRRHPYGRLFAALVAPRLGPVKEREPAPPLQFAQLVGLIFAVIGVAGFALGAPLVGVVATAFALVAAFLNAAFGICLGCQLYPLVVRFRPSAGRA
ncbi:DUF4395 domain-containing protein [Mycobacterium sherrisii]|uniref:DUF4395 domain-containing protein n=1 Tax=Mycobacterium sherrisii TaxID=243061 RepID=A0A1E3SEF9_9MYCO|nr:DUF4395 domain-containing protein [Mycobacterium sherrisii]MCV7030271.1 DUF4395 domain-containing protein [Mycobacterium sherrisii]ODR00521.1 hypothetical protein BHQ21_24325 [Mycobacterium sherrisii]ORW78096.1 hypothetical protein AWC25_07185 [Mycobacterium sherrisii]